MQLLPAGGARTGDLGAGAPGARDGTIAIRRLAAVVGFTCCLVLAVSGCSAGLDRLNRIAVAPEPVGVLAGAPASAPSLQGQSAPVVELADQRPVGTRPPPTPAVELSAEVKRCLGTTLPRLKGTVVERTFVSRALGQPMRYVAYVPAGDSAAGGGFPVLYMLHGRGGERTEWLSAGLFDAIDRSIASGKAIPMIVVVPEGQTGYWTDHADAGPRWGEYIVSDLVGDVDDNFNTRRQPAARAIGGESMGGWGALHHALRHPDVFGIAGAHSPALRPDDGSLAFLGRGTEYATKDPMSLARGATSVVKQRMWIDTGEDDPWAARATALHRILAERGVDHSWQLNPGDHSWTYWRAHLAEYIDFYSRSFLELSDAH